MMNRISFSITVQFLAAVVPYNLTYRPAVWNGKWKFDKKSRFLKLILCIGVAVDSIRCEWWGLNFEVVVFLQIPEFFDRMS